MAVLRAATDGQHMGDMIARRFPLVPRTKPACRPLAWRLDRVTRLAGQAAQAGSDGPRRAAEALNHAALIASDSGMPGLARDLCWRQFDICAAGGGTAGVPAAKRTLQPLINLARLRIRADDGTGGCQLLQSLFESIRDNQPQAILDGRITDLAFITTPGEQHEAIVQWLWTVMLSDGLRGLCRAGRWSEALSRAEHHHGIGQRLLDGRQIAILAHVHDGQHDAADQLLQATAPGEPWEHLVADCLQAINDAHRPGRAAGRLAQTYLASDDATPALFRVRLGLTIARLTTPTADTHTVIDKVTRIAAQADDAYAAQEILDSPGPGIPPETDAELCRIVTQASLGQPLRSPDSRRLMNAVEAAETALAASLPGTGFPACSSP
jgi:hypothetical protein